VSRADIDVIKALMKAYKGNQLRLPLHVAVMISPLYLLVPIQLYSVKWERHAMFLVRQIFSLVAFSDDFQTSKALGNSKPPLLVEVENQLLALLFRLACSERDLRTEIQDFSSWLEGKRPELINEAPDTRAWFKSDPSRTQNKTSSTSMNVLAPKFPVFTLSLQRRSVGNVAIGGGNQQVGNGHMDSPEVNVSDEDKDKSDEDRIDEDKIDDDSLDEDRIDETNPDMDRIDKDKAENDGLDTDKMDIDGNWDHERAGYRNGDSGAAENASVGGLAGEGNDEDDDDMDNNGMEDIIDTDMGRRASVAGENVGGDSGAEDGMKGRESSSEEDVEENGDEDDDVDALSSIAEEDDDEGRCGKAEKGKKPQKEGKLLIKIPSRERSKDWNLGKAGLQKETAIDVDTFFVSNLSDGFLMGLLTLAFLVCRRNFLGTPKKSEGSD
jgi:hypothetical protein